MSLATHRLRRSLCRGLVGLFEFDLVAEITGETFGETNVVSRIVYVLVGAAGLYLAATVLPAMLRAGSDGARHDRTVRV